VLHFVPDRSDQSLGKFVTQPVQHEYGCSLVELVDFVLCCDILTEALKMLLEGT
jgi:hypothetical protein